MEFGVATQEDSHRMAMMIIATLHNTVEKNRQKLAANAPVVPGM